MIRYAAPSRSTARQPDMFLVHARPGRRNTFACRRCNASFDTIYELRVRPIVP